jgi:hypothetical protein
MLSFCTVVVAVGAFLQGSRCCGELLIPTVKTTQILLASSEQHDSGSYLAFPAVLQTGNDVLISFKRGQSHAADTGASLELLRIDSVTGSIRSRSMLARDETRIMQMGEWVQYSETHFASLIDVQKNAAPSRTGLQMVRTTDGGFTFSRPAPVGSVDGIEYGYAFDSITEDGTTFVLAMNFSNLPGGRSVYTSRHAGSVDVICTRNEGRTWHFVRNLSAEFGNIPINESAFIRAGTGYLVTCRSYDQQQWLARTDLNFQKQILLSLTGRDSAIRSHIGRPRLFERDGRWYLMGRNQIDEGPMRLSLFRIDPENLQISHHVVLDNNEASDVTDGYYAAPYWTSADDHTLFHVVTYRGVSRNSPDLIRLSFDWDEVR